MGIKPALDFTNRCNSHYSCGVRYNSEAGEGKIMRLEIYSKNGEKKWALRMLNRKGNVVMESKPEFSMQKAHDFGKKILSELDRNAGISVKVE